MKRRGKKNIYLDHAAATPLELEVFKAMRPFFGIEFANPSGLYAAAVRARDAVESARKKVADALFTQPEAIIFTSGGTESINIAILGVARMCELRTVSANFSTSSRQVIQTANKPHIISTAIEHHAVLDAIKHLGNDSFAVTYLPVNREGLISIDDFKKALRRETVLVSIMYANNEIGSIQPIAEVGREILKWRKQQKSKIKNQKSKINWPYLHTDACQAAGYLDLNVEKLHVDLLSANGSKIYGPRGSGVLYKRRGVELEPLMYGGGQEWGLRSGTENVPGIVGFAKALELVRKDRAKEGKRLEKLRDYFWTELQKRVQGMNINGPRLSNQKSVIRNQKSTSDCRLLITDFCRLPNNLNAIFDNADAEAMIIYLDAAGIQCSSGSACTEATDETSHVLLACGLSEDAARSSLRFTLGKGTTKKDIDYVLKVLPGVVEKCRMMTRM